MEVFTQRFSFQVRFSIFVSYFKATFHVSSIMHPETYLNKILFGSNEGALQLWNVKTNKLIYTFKGWESGICTIKILK